MGFAAIVGGGADGRYSIRIDYGEAQRVANVDALTQKLAVVNERITETQALVDVGSAAEAAQLAAINEFIVQLEAAMNELPPGSSLPDLALAFDAYIKQLRAIEAENAPNKIALATLKAIKAQTTAQLATFEQLQTVETRPAWCADFTEDASGFVATLEIPGESALILIAPGARVWVGQIDGALASRELMSPAQAYFNAAILPGWQIDRPGYRWGTLTSIDWDGNTGNVTLGAALSSAQQLNVNRGTSLSGVPFDYMQTHCRAFNNDSRVVVSLRQGWESPTVIGFLESPRPDPPTYLGGINGRNFLIDEPAEAWDLSIAWEYGADPRDYSVVEGSLPAGLSLNSTTGIISGTPTVEASNSGIVVRCFDAFYDEAKNRRYGDCEPFTINVLGGWSFNNVNGGSLFIAASAFFAIYIKVYTLEHDGNIDFYTQTQTYVPGTGYVIDTVKISPPVMVGSDILFAPLTDLHARVTISGNGPDGYHLTDGPDAPREGVLEVWENAFGLQLEWAYVVNDVVGVKSAGYTIEFALDDAGTEIVSTITGSIELEHLPF